MGHTRRRIRRGRYANTPSVILMPELVYNLCPTMNSPVLRIVDGSRRLNFMHWQLIPRYESPLIVPLLPRLATLDFFGTDDFRECVEVLFCFDDVLRDRVEDERDG